ncbi:MAG: GNAT family N-acetyltransferase [Dehalococcoidia bacterium]|nr:GNAT family N-acetyltransferase [Dehalococcoidia bacterium]
MNSCSINILEKSFDEMANDWNDIFDSYDGNQIFTSFELQKTWWDHFGNDFENRIILMSKGDSKIIVPFKLSGNTGSLIGSKDLFDYQDFVYSGCSDIHQFMECFAHYLAKDIDVNELKLTSIPRESPILTILPEYLEKNNWTVNISNEDVTPKIQIPNSWGDYLGSLKKKHRHEIRRKIRRLYNYGKVEELEVRDYNGVQEHLDDFFVLHRISSAEKQNFMTPERESFFRDIALKLCQQGILRLRFLIVNSIKVAASMSFVNHEVEYLYNSGYNPDFNDLSVGILNHVFSIRKSIIEKNNVFDFMRGNEIYKYRLGGTDEHIFKLMAQKT